MLTGRVSNRTLILVLVVLVSVSGLLASIYFHRVYSPETPPATTPTGTLETPPPTTPTGETATVTPPATTPTGAFPTETTVSSQTIPVDSQPPIVEGLEFRVRVERGGLQSIVVCVRESNPGGYVVLMINGMEIRIPLKDVRGEVACYSISFNPSEYFGGEGVVSGEIVLVDKYGNSNSQNIRFLVNLEAPRIVSVKVERLGLGKYQVKADVVDENLQNVYIVVNGSKIPLTKDNGEFKTLLETLKDLNFVLYAEDKYSMTSSYQGKIEFSKDNPNVAYALGKGLDVKYISLIAPLDNDRFQDVNEKQFVDLIIENNKLLTIPTYSRYLKERASDGIITSDELTYSNNFSTLVKGLYDLIYKLQYYRDPIRPYVRDPIRTTDYSSNLGLRLGFDKELAKDATIKAIGYYGIAVIDRDLPEEFQAISLLTRATQIEKYGEKLVDFSPIVFRSADGIDFVLTPDVGRETWMLARHIKLILDSGFDVLKHPEMFEGLNGKIIANAYSIFDARYGINYAEKILNGRTLDPADNDVWNLIMLQWNLYSNKAPQLGGGDKLYNRDFPWYDSDKLDSLYQDPNTRRQALFFLFYIDNGTFDMERAQKFDSLTETLPREVRDDLYELIKFGETVRPPNIYPNYTARSVDDILRWIDLVTYEKKLIDENTAEKLKNEIKTIPPRFTPVGIEGARTALIQAEREYEVISRLYPNGKVRHPWWDVPAWWYYYGFVRGEGMRGLWNTHLQYVGLDPIELGNIMASDPENLWNNIKHLNGVDQYITKNWVYWDLVKFVIGYEMWKLGTVPGAIGMHDVNYAIPQALRAFGFPVYWVEIRQTPDDTVRRYGFVVSLPDYVVGGLRDRFGDGVIVGPANGFGLYLCKDGLIKDGINEIFGFSGGTGLLADKWPSLGLGSNFRFYLFKK
jgi:hypothetical protein